MRRVKIAELPERERLSPNGKYHALFREISVGLGRERASLDLAKRHPFDLEICRIPPGRARCPYHAHSAQSELYVVLSGRGKVRHDGGTDEVSAGDAFFFGPSEAHQLRNEGPEDFVYYVIADNPMGESCYYPDSDKWSVELLPNETIVKGKETPYYEGEE